MSAQIRSYSSAVEDYVKAIYALAERSGSDVVATGALAEHLDVTPGSATGMAKKLVDLGLASHMPYRGVRLTAAGADVAVEVLRHHRLLELFLVEELGVPWDRVHEEADVLEHVLSEEVEELIARKLGDPSRDPHGDPIPDRDGQIAEDESMPLDALEVGDRGVFVRVSDSDPEMLRFLSAREIRPGSPLEVVDKQPFGGPTFVRIDDDVHALGDRLARTMRVQVGS